MTRRVPDAIARRAVVTGLAAFTCRRAWAQGQSGHSHGASAQPGSDPLAERFGGPFSLTDHTGKRVSDEAYRGRFMLVYFGFTRCADTCPIDLPTIAQALDALGPLAERVAPLFVTVDPAHDSVPVLAAYVAAFHPALIGLTGSEAEIAAVAKAYKVHRRKLTQPHHGAGEYAVDHGSLTYLMDRDGRFLTLLPHRTGAERMAAVLRRYLA
ncbi:SCO family protein [Bosea sp. 124]|uniref:SCO family protein n=1 Tax=Bosea sp. 124 TaxID=2135642 RepID=UPI000D3F4604|nr:SCO family protein [Bosea sp. 124]PTM38943.1 protein SCO1/2 [Bosea sp. 124]